MRSFIDIITARHPNIPLSLGDDAAPYCQDWRNKFKGKTLGVFFPRSTQEVASLVGLACEHKVSIVPQGGNTGLSGGATPDASGRQLILNLSRMNRIRSVDPENKTITVDAGVTMQSVHEAADQHDLLFPLSLTAKGTATIGGNLSTNAGGTAVLRYGNARALCLGLEVVTPSGEIWNGLRGLRKDNTGYSLKDLFIGAEGTLGIITGAVLALHPKPAAQVTALACVPNAQTAVQLLQRAQAQCDANLTGFEFMTPESMQPVSVYFPQFAKPGTLGTEQDCCVLLEISHPRSEAEGRVQLEQVLSDAIEEGLVSDAIVAQSLSQAQSFWDLREHITFAGAEDGPQVKFDISLPISAIAAFCDRMKVDLQSQWPGLRLSNFGHLGDGNLHFNIAVPEALGSGLDRAQRHAVFADYVNTHEDAIRICVHDQVNAMSGSISAEHGLGQLRRDEAARLKSKLELGLMRQIKTALDPQNLFNPNKVLST
jgi:FAD/FMN-containing dehydrogenase